MSSHVNPKVNDQFKKCMNCNYVKHCQVNTNRGKVHEYPGMNFDFTEKVKVKNSMENYVERVITEFPMKISKSDTYLNLDGNNLFEKGNRKSMGKKETEYFHN